MADENIEQTNGVVETELPLETPTEAPIEGTPEVTEPVVEESPQETPKEETPKEEVAEPAKEEVAPPVFTVETPIEDLDKVLDGYELPADVAAVVANLKERVAAVPVNSLEQYADYAPPGASPEVIQEAVRTLLDRQVLLTSVKEEGEGQMRPRTDEYVQTLSQQEKEWLHFDLAKAPSQKYQGLNLFAEGIADLFGKPGDTVGTVLDRYHQAIEAVQSGVMPQADIPEFIHPSLKDAYWSLSKEGREELSYLDPATDRFEYDDNGRPTNLDESARNSKLNDLVRIQKGIDAERREAQMLQEAHAVKQQAFSTEVMDTQLKFYDALGESVVADLVKSVQFSTDPKIQNILAHQNYAMLAQAAQDDNEGARTRQVLADAGITIDYPKIQQLMKDIEYASVAIAQAKQLRSADGNVMNPVEPNKAQSQFKKATAAWQSEIKRVIDLEAKLISTGTTEAVQKAAEKIKIAPKARAQTVGSPTQAKKVDTAPAYKSPEWYDKYVNPELERESTRAAAYK